MNWHFVSDLHLFARRSLAAQFQSELERVVKESNTVVLGGDIFDFRWSTRGDLEQSVTEAIGWLADLIAQNEDCRFFYLLGNHDCNETFMTQLADLSEQRSNLEWHETHWRVDDTVFLHGDVADKMTLPAELLRHRDRWQSESIQPKSGFRQNLYDVALWLRLHKVVGQIVHRPWAVAQRVLYYLNALDLGPANGVSKVYFGHTHAPLSGYEYDGMKFFNGGAPLRGVRFRILPVDTSGFTS